MPIKSWVSTCALLIAAQCLAVGALPGPFAVVFMLLCVASVTLLAWIATDGAHPTPVVAGGMLLAFFSAPGQPEFLAGAAAAAATGFLLSRKKDPACVESSQP
jgi:predicted signal transduction protein with EAL and GGDEF domain